jgi:crotonobetainyl-CoA:carnitine CoA-transferase CaiB-like acyl-CoA transferase
MAGLPAMPLEFGTARDRPPLRRQPPRIGEHNDEVLAAAGYSQAEIAKLARATIIAGP